MMFSREIRFILYALCLFCFIGCSSGAIKKQRPNIVFFLADDLGYGELGVYGQEIIETPNIDALAANGMKFSQHYSGAPVCAPARYVFLTGEHTGHAFIRGNDEWNERGDVWDYKMACLDPTLEGQRPIPSNTITLGKQLKKAGYTTSITGKWGLGAPETEGFPNLQGFDYFYGYNCQRQAHNLYPPHLWENDLKDNLNNEMVPPRTKLDSLADPYEESSYDLFNQEDYAPEKIHQRALQFIQENKDKPFFMYYASPLPHLPLQAPKSYVDKYRKILGEEEPYLGDKGYFPNRYPRATYAAMISYLDFQLGELIQTLKDEGIYENTVIIFSSDYGRTKGFVYEGGIRIPLIVSWEGKIKKGSQSDHISAFYDLMPTICDLANIDPPEDIDGLSFKAALLNQDQKPHDFLYWEFPSYQGQQAVRLGKWKGIRKNIFKGNLAIELYDLDHDILELNDVSDRYPEIVKRIEEIMIQEHEPSENDRFKFVQLGDQ